MSSRNVNKNSKKYKKGKKQNCPISNNGNKTVQNQEQQQKQQKIKCDQSDQLTIVEQSTSSLLSPSPPSSSSSSSSSSLSQLAQRQSGIADINKLSLQEAGKIRHDVIHKNPLSSEENKEIFSSTTLLKALQNIQGRNCNQNENNDNNTSNNFNLLKNLLQSLNIKNDNNNQSEAEDEDPKKIFEKMMMVATKVPKLSDMDIDNSDNDDDAGVNDGDDDNMDDDFVEYIFTPRRYFIYSACELCKTELLENHCVPCKDCNMTYYCSIEHMEGDKNHLQLCYALKKIAYSRGGHIYQNLFNINADDYRSYRVMTMNTCEQLLNRQLLPYEREIIIFPRNCVHCREWKMENIENCKICGQVYCKNIPLDIQEYHQKWCKSFALLRKLIILQEKCGKIETELKTNLLTHLPSCLSSMKEILKKLNADQKDICLYAILSQIASAPLTIWYGLKISQKIYENQLTIHLIGAEMQYEADKMQKWEHFILHITPAVQILNIIFIGPELIPSDVSMEPLIKLKLCQACQDNKRKINLYFINGMYHDYCRSSSSTSYKQPNLICFFNPGLYRTTGYNCKDTWPETIRSASQQLCPIVVTSYTQYESPLDLQRFLKESQRPVQVLLPPTQNPFSSNKPERNFISDEKVPLIFKNFYIFILE